LHHVIWRNQNGLLRWDMKPTWEDSIIILAAIIVLLLLHDGISEFPSGFE
jgi:hypothetical protein